MGGSSSTRCGFIALSGRPNVGKSTLINALVGEKISIVAPKPQTTRHRIHGIRTEADVQMVFVDTPGLHLRQKRGLNAILNRTAGAALADVDLIVMMIEAGQWREEDEAVLRRVREAQIPAGLVLSKVDRLRDRAKLLPEMKRLSDLYPFQFMVPLSVHQNDNVDALLTEVRQRLPESPFLYPGEQKTDRAESFRIAEVIREKLVLLLQQELPYAMTVTVDAINNGRALKRIDATVWVARDAHKAIVIGRKGAMLRDVGARARRDLEQRAGCKVMLSLWVKVREGWADDERALRSLGFDDV